METANEAGAVASFLACSTRLIGIQTPTYLVVNRGLLRDSWEIKKL